MQFDVTLRIRNLIHISMNTENTIPSQRYQGWPPTPDQLRRLQQLVKCWWDMPVRHLRCLLVRVREFKMARCCLNQFTPTMIEIQFRHRRHLSLTGTKEIEPNKHSDELSASFLNPRRRRETGWAPRFSPNLILYNHFAHVPTKFQVQRRNQQPPCLQNHIDSLRTCYHGRRLM